MTDISTDTVVSTGSTTARSLATRFSETANILDFGADPTGGVDATSAINGALDTGRPVLIPAGTYTIDGTVSATAANPYYLYGPVSLPQNGLPWETDGSAWKGNSGFGFGQMLDQGTNQAVVAIQAQVPDITNQVSYETVCLRVQMEASAVSSPGH